MSKAMWEKIGTMDHPWHKQMRDAKYERIKDSEIIKREQKKQSKLPKAGRCKGNE